MAKVVKKWETSCKDHFIKCKKIFFRFALKSMEMRAKVLIRLVSLTKLAQIDNGDSTTLKSLP